MWFDIVYACSPASKCRAIFGIQLRLPNVKHMASTDQKGKGFMYLRKNKLVLTNQGTQNISFPFIPSTVLSKNVYSRGKSKNHTIESTVNSQKNIHAHTHTPPKNAQSLSLFTNFGKRVRLTELQQQHTISSCHTPSRFATNDFRGIAARTILRRG